MIKINENDEDYEKIDKSDFEDIRFALYEMLLGVKGLDVDKINDMIDEFLCALTGYRFYQIKEKQNKLKLEDKKKMIVCFRTIKRFGGEKYVRQIQE